MVFERIHLHSDGAYKLGYCMRTISELWLGHLTARTTTYMQVDIPNRWIHYCFIHLPRETSMTIPFAPCFYVFLASHKCKLVDRSLAQHPCVIMNSIAFPRHCYVNAWGTVLLTLQRLHICSQWDNHDSYTCPSMITWMSLPIEA